MTCRRLWFRFNRATGYVVPMFAGAVFAYAGAAAWHVRRWMVRR